MENTETLLDIESSEFDEMNFDDLKPIKVNFDAALKESNRLVNACYFLTLTEQKIMLAVISQLSKDADNLEISKINVRDLAKLCNFEQNVAYKQVRKATLTLMKRVLRLRDKNGDEYATHWVQSCRFIKGRSGQDSCVVYHIDGSIRDDLLKLHEAYVCVKLADAFKLSSQYAIRLYLIGLEWLNVGCYNTTPERLRKTFGLDGKKSYATYWNLYNRVIEPAIEQINERTDIKITYMTKVGGVRGRTVTDIRFGFERKNPAPILTEPSDDDIQIGVSSEVSTLDGLNAKDRAMAKRLNEVGNVVPMKTAADLVRKFGYDRCHDNFEPKQKEFAMKGKPLNGGLVRWLIENDVLRQDAQEKKEFEEREQKKKDEKKAVMEDGVLGQNHVNKEDMDGVSIDEIMEHLADEHDGDDAVIYEYIGAGITFRDARGIVAYGLDVLRASQRKKWDEAGYKVEDLRRLLIKHDKKMAAKEAKTKK